MMNYRILMAAGIFLFCCGGSAAADGLKKLSVVPVWKPQAQFAGYYMAAEKGIYAKYGLDVTILEGGSEYPPEELLKDGRADFALMWLSSALQERSRGVELVNIAQVVRHSSLMLIAKRSSGIVRPQDLQGKKISLWEGALRLQPEAFFRQHELSVTTIPQAYTVNLFLSGGVDAVSAMLYNEYHTILNAGLDPDELTVFLFSAYGLNFPEDGIYTLSKSLKDDPGRAAAFVRASLEGWRYAFDHEDETLDVVLRYMREAHIPADRPHQQWMLGKMRALIDPDGDGRGMGVLDKEDYARVVRELIKTGLISKAVDLDVFYRPVGIK